MIGKTISHYRILEKLGEGGMGVVYKAHDLDLKRAVAIKFLPRQIVASEEERQRFKIEAQAAAALNHPNIATIHAIEEVDDEMFIVMEYIDGQELKSLIDNNQLSIDNALNYATQIASGLQAAHKKGVTHRDIKSSNIMITEEDQVKIMDFGLAKIRGGGQFTKVGTTLGTAAYMSPEQAQGMETDHRTDIWAFGVVLYEMLTGRVPFPGDYEQAVIYSILNEEPESITHIRPEIDKSLELLVGRTLTKNRDERYQNIRESLTDLKTIAKGEPTLDMDRKPAVKSKISASTKLWLGVAGIVGITLIILFAFVFNSSEPGFISNEKSIAVMPFADMSPEKDQAYFADGMAEEIINALTQIPGLKVSARTSAFQFREQENDIQTIGAKLGVTTILKGSVRKSGNTLRITAQLVNVADGFHLWSNTYDREMTDIFAIQDELSRSIVEALLQVKLSGDEAQAPSKRQTTNIEAYNLYLRGRYFWNRRTEQGLKRSIDFFQQAIDLDPTYALAYAGLADAYVILGWWQYLEPKETFTKAKSAARKALEIDDSLAEAHAALAFSKFTYDWDWQGAEKEFKRAIALNPKYASAHQWYADWLGIMGRYDEARAEMRKALELDPLSLIINAASGLLYQYAGDDDWAIRQLNKTLEMDPNFIPAHSWLFGSYLRKGMHDKSFNHFIAAYSAFYELTSEEKDAVHTIYEDFGWDGIARFMIAKLEVRSKEKYVSPADLSMYYVLLGDHEQALDYLEKAYQIRSSRMAYLGVMPEFEALHSEPRFQALLEKMGLPQ